MGLDDLAVKIFKFPAWTVLALAFNDTVATLLALVQALDATGIRSRLVIDIVQDTSQAIQRADLLFPCLFRARHVDLRPGPENARRR